MTATEHIKIDIVKKFVKPRVHAMQYDIHTRVVAITLLAGHAAFTPPDGTTFALSYRKADGTKGFYNQLADDVSAISVSENVVSVILAPQVLTYPGKVDAALVMSATGDDRLSTFPFEIHVEADPSAGTTESDDYFNCGSASGVSTIYYNSDTFVSSGASRKISKASTASWTSIGFHTEPKKNDLVISASSQMFKVTSVLSTYLTMSHLADLGGSGVSSWNDLRDKPFEAPDVLYAWNIDNEYEEVVSGAYSGPVGSGMSVDDVFFCKVSEDTPAMDIFADTTLYTVTEIDKGGCYRTSSHVPYAVSYSEQVYVAGLFVVVMADSAEYCGLTLTKGVWCSNITFDDKDPLDDSVPAPVCTLIAEILRSEGKPLHDLSIPENIARWGEVLTLIDEKLGVIENGTY